MQPPQRGNPVSARAEHKMIGVPKHTLGPGGPNGISRHGLDGSNRPYRHESRCLQRAVSGPDDTGTRLPVRCLDLEAKPAG